MFPFFKKQCPQCDAKLKYRVPRKLLHRLIPFSKRFRCLKCDQYCLKIIK